MTRQLEGTQLGPYRLIRQLGEGGMGAVYEAVHEAIARQVAIKILHPEYSQRAEILKRFFNEARAVNLIDHPGLVQISDYGQTPEHTAYIVMELLRGESLSKRIKQRGAMSAADALPIASQIAGALAAVHAKRIIHRDLKPENVMLVPDPEQPGRERAKLLDFGIAKLAEGTTSEGDRTRTNMLMGTPAYMSPEQCRGAGRVDERADCYSFGILLYEMLSGQRPFVGEGTGDLLIKHIAEPPPLLREVAAHVPEPLAALVHRLLAKAKEQRPSMQETLAELRQLMGDPITNQAPAARPSWLTSTIGSLWRKAGPQWTLEQSAGQYGSRASRRRLTSVVGGLVVLVGVGAGSLYLFQLRRTTSDGSQLMTAGKSLQPRAGETSSATTPPVTNPPAPAPKSVPTIEWQIISSPSGAQVVRKDSGAILGTTPFALRQPAQPESVRLLLRRPGYQPMEVTVAGDANSNLEKRLLPLPGRSPPATSGLVKKSPAASPSTASAPPASTSGQPHDGPAKKNDKDTKNAPPVRRDLLEN